MILFTPEHAEMILAGRKTQTRRRGKHRWRLGAEHSARTTLFGEPFAILRILGVRLEGLGDMQPADARHEGYATLGEYMAAWEQINGRWNFEEKVWVVDFEIARKLK